MLAKIILATLLPSALGLTLSKRTGVYPVNGYNGTFTDQATINAPNGCGSYITYIAHPANNYDPSLCAADCQTQSQETNPFQGLRCHFFTSYQLLKNGQVLNQICALYSRTWDASYATNTGYYAGSDHYTVANAFSYSNTNNIGTFTCPQGNSAPSQPSTPSQAPNPAPPSVAALTACPQGAQYIVANDNALFSICVDTDYQIPSPQIYYGVSDNRACGLKCDQQSGCTEAVYNLGTQTCYLKGNTAVANSNWRPSPGFQTLNRVPDNTPVTQCLAPLYSIVQNGKQYAVCPSHDLFPGAAVNTWGGIYNEYDCAAKCQSTNGCVTFAWSPTYNTCYNKGAMSTTNIHGTVQMNFNSYWAL